MANDGYLIVFVSVCAVCVVVGWRGFPITPHRSFTKCCGLQRPQTPELRLVVQSCKNEWAMDNNDAAEESKNEECPNEEVGN